MHLICSNSLSGKYSPLPQVLLIKSISSFSFNLNSCSIFFNSIFALSLFNELSISIKVSLSASIYFPSLKLLFDFNLSGNILHIYLATSGPPSPLKRPNISIFLFVFG